MSDINHIGAMTIGIIREGLINRNEKIKEILEADTSVCYNPDFGRVLEIRRLSDNLPFELEDKKDD